MTVAQGEDAKIVEMWSNEQVLRAVLAPLKATFGADVVEAAGMMGVVVTEWSHDEWILGAYSYARAGVVAGGDPAARDALVDGVEDGSLYFAGEAVVEGVYGTVHGALLSARRAAHRVQVRDMRGGDPLGDVCRV